MTELLTTQPYGIAAILMALAFLINRFAHLVIAANTHFGPFALATIAAIQAWTKRTNDERDCAPKLADALARIGKLERLAKAAVDAERRALADAMTGAGSIEDRVDLSERGDEPTGDQHVPVGLPPWRKKR